MGMKQTQPEPDISWMIRSVELMLRPVARIFVGKLSCTVAVNLLREAYIREARRYIERTTPNKRITKSSLALLTGLDTRMISAIDAEGEEQRAALSIGDVCPEASVLDTWAREPTYLDQATGKPRQLPIYGRGVSFQTLVGRAAGRNVTCNTVLDRLTESGNLRVVEGDYVELVSQHYMPVNPSERTAIEAGSASLNRLGRSVSHNMIEDSSIPRWLQQDRWSARIPVEAVAPLRARLRDVVEQQILEVEQELDQAEQPVQRDDQVTVGFGWFYWESPDQSLDR